MSRAFDSRVGGFSENQVGLKKKEELSVGLDTVRIYVDELQTLNPKP